MISYQLKSKYQAYNTKEVGNEIVFNIIISVFSDCWVMDDVYSCMDTVPCKDEESYKTKPTGTSQACDDSQNNRGEKLRNSLKPTLSQNRKCALFHWQIQIKTPSFYHCV